MGTRNENVTPQLMHWTMWTMSVSIDSEWVATVIATVSFSDSGTMD